MNYSEQYLSHINDIKSAFLKVMVTSGCAVIDKDENLWGYAIPYDDNKKITPSELIDIVDNSVNDLSEGLESIIEDKYADFCDSKLIYIMDKIENHFISNKRTDIETWEIENYVLDHIEFIYPIKIHMEDEACVMLQRKDGELSASCLSLYELNEAMHVDGRFSVHIARMMQSFTDPLCV